MAKNVVVAYFAARRRWLRENEEPQPRHPGLRPRDEKRHYYNMNKVHYCIVNLFSRVNELEIPRGTRIEFNCVTNISPVKSFVRQATCTGPKVQYGLRYLCYSAL
jgi:hypothetical protein